MSVPRTVVSNWGAAYKVAEGVVVALAILALLGAFVSYVDRLVFGATAYAHEIACLEQNLEPVRKPLSFTVTCVPY